MFSFLKPVTCVSLSLTCACFTLSPVWSGCGFIADLIEEFGTVFKLFSILPVWIISLAPTSSPRSINQKLFNLKACDERGL